MKLRRWCVSQVSEPLALYWTLRSAEKDYWARMKFQGAAERVGLYRWDGSEWRKQVYTLLDIGRQKVWLDSPKSNSGREGEI